MHVCMYVYMYLYACIYMHVCMHVCMYVCVCMYVMYLGMNCMYASWIINRLYIVLMNYLADYLCCR